MTSSIEDPWGDGTMSGIGGGDLSVPDANSSTPNSPVVIEEVNLEDPEDVVLDESKSHEEKSQILQKMLFSASSNGDIDRVHDLLGSETTRPFIDVNRKDENGSTALIYSSCFGHDAVVAELLRFSASPDEQDKHEWTALMWAINNHHTSIVRQLIENEASVTLKTSTGRSALNFVTPHSDIYKYLEQRGYINDTGAEDDFYFQAKDPNEVEEELSRQFMIESAAINLDVDLAHLNVKDDDDDDFYDGTTARTPRGDDDEDDNTGSQHFIWERCLPDQMFVFNISDIPRILNIAITDMQPQRSRSQKPVPANMIFLSARYAHYYCNEETLEHLLNPVIMRIRSVMNEHTQDIAFLAFWLSNCSLLLYYLRKDPGLNAVTTQFQGNLSQLIGDIYVLITQDVELRFDKTLDASILDHETIPGLDAIAYQSEWKIFKSKAKPLTHKEEVDQVTKPPSPKRKAQPSPRNITSVLSSVLFVMDLYDVHPIITQQIISQILFWLGAVLFNRVMSNRKYLARSRAMQVRLNVSAIEDWARSNNRQPEQVDEFGNSTATTTSKSNLAYLSIVDICQRHFSSLVQILQWLQCFTGFGDDFTNVIATLQQLTNLNPLQLLHVAKKYRAEVGEKGLSKEYKAYLAQLAVHHERQYTHHATVDKPDIKREIRAANDKSKGKDKENVDNATSSKVEEKVVATTEKSSTESQSNGNVDNSSSQKPNNKPENTVQKADAAESDSKEEEQSSKEKENTTKPEEHKSSAESSDDSSNPAISAEDEERQKQPVQTTFTNNDSERDEQPGKLEIYLDASEVLPFIIPTLREMIVTWGAGLGGVNKQRAKKYEPSLPTDIIDKFDLSKEESDEYNDATLSSTTGASALDGGDTSMFQALAVPQPSVHKSWGDDPSVTDDLDAGW
ncbi:hypothetical protein AWJ20_4987 [Sugiyamaella lignohabitans]|uniref:Dilute domain-containing protein n=1 Tax=Sugiyamaella lignohabitans TaxID=796027 RepID=A0A167EFW8_9ASCO|nr:uncharacterized protein AWJ20_4987 [Sugiyamaella lignohabitans]ANB14031.1 hypothetical protein AWJ20_4987 [Sugiyamaella lignohabitans]